jgi:hypothetical protein
VGVREGLLRDRWDRRHLVHNNIRHQLDIHQGIEVLREDPRSRHHDDRCLSSGLPTEDHNTNNNVIHSNNSLGLFNRTDQGFRLVGQQLLLRGPGVLDRRPDVGHVESHITSMTVQVERARAVGSVGHTTVGDLGKAHQIHAAVNNRQAEHQSTVLETSGTIVDQTFSILIDPRCYREIYFWCNAKNN